MKLFRSIVAATSVFMIGQALMAIGNHSPLSVEIGNFETANISKEITLIPSSKMERTSIPQSEGRSSVVVKCELTGNDRYTPFRTLIYNTDHLYSITGSGQIKVEPGQYDLCAEFVCGNYDEPYFARVIRENVDITKLTVMTFDVEEAVNVIFMGSILEDGSPVVLPPSEDDGSEYNCEKIVLYTIATHDDYNFFSYGVGEAGFVGPKGSSENSFGFRVNDVSEKYHFMQSRLLRLNENEVMYHFPVVHGAKGGGTILFNKPEAVVKVRENFQFTPLSGEYNRLFDNYQSQGMGLFRGRDVGGFSATFGGDECVIRVVDNSLEEADPVFQPMVFGGILDVQDVVLTFDEKGNITGQESIQTGVFGSPLILKGGEIIHVNPNNSILDNTSVVFPQKNFLHGHDAFSYRHGEKGMDYNNNSPIILSMPRVGEIGEKKCVQLSLYSIGRWGEVRRSDLFRLSGKIFDNKDEILYEGTHHGFNEAIAKSVAAGKDKLRMVAENCNIEVDGEPVKTMIEMNWDSSGDTKVPPILTMLQTKTRDGCLTDRFENPEQGIIEFTGGVFRWDESYGGYTEMAPASVKVEAAGATGEYVGLETEEIPELYHMPGFGHFYRANVNGIKENGWHTLRITLADDEGNKQIQTLERAFKVEDVSNVSEIVGDQWSSLSGSILRIGEERVTVLVYNIDGRRQAEFNFESGVYDLADYLPKGVFIIKCDNDIDASVFKLTIQ